MTFSERLRRLMLGVLLLTALGTLWNSSWLRRPECALPSEEERHLAPLPPLPAEEPYLLPPPPADPAALAAALFSYIELPQRWCRRLAMLGGHWSSLGAIDGNKFICLDPPLAPQPPCLVYSFGGNDEWSFERDVIRDLRCEVHTFDPSLSAAPRNTHGALFHALGLGGRTRVTPGGWKLATLRNIRGQLGHEARRVSYLKVDVEGAEWGWLEAEAEALLDVQQIGMEVHLEALTPGALRRAYAVFRRLQAAGFRTVFSEANRVWGRNRTVTGVDRKVGKFYEVVWVRIQGLPNDDW